MFLLGILGKFTSWHKMDFLVKYLLERSNSLRAGRRGSIWKRRYGNRRKGRYKTKERRELSGYEVNRDCEKSGWARPHCFADWAEEHAWNFSPGCCGDLQWGGHHCPEKIWKSLYVLQQHEGAAWIQGQADLHEVQKRDCQKRIRMPSNKKAALKGASR